MPNNDEMEEVLSRGKEYLQDKGPELMHKGVKQVKESGKDWWYYVEDHPIQSMIFGVIGYFALKGLFKS